MMAFQFNISGKHLVGKDWTLAIVSEDNHFYFREPVFQATKNIHQKYWEADKNNTCS